MLMMWVGCFNIFIENEIQRMKDGNRERVRENERKKELKIRKMELKENNIQRNE